MKKSILYIIWLFCGFLLFFLGLQKPLFIIYNDGFQGNHATLSDLWDIYRHGLPIDLATVGYLLIIPLLILGVYWCFPRWNLRPLIKGYCLIMAVALSLAALADASLYEFWEFKLDRMAFFYLNDPKNAFASVSVGYMVVRFLAWVLLSAVTYMLLVWPLGRKMFRISYEMDERPAGGLMPILGRLLLFVVLVGLDFAMIRGLRIWPNTPGRVFYSKTTYFNHAALNPLFNLFYSLTKKEDDYSQFDVFDEETLSQIMDGLFPTTADSTELMLTTQRPNILVVVLEGFGSCFVEGLGGDLKDVGVNFNRLLPKSIYFPNCYCGSFRTDRGIVCTLSGYLGQPTTSIMRYAHKIKNLPGLPAKLREHGYQTQGVYGGDITFFNMSEYYITAGHDKLVSQDDFPASERTTKWGVPDHAVFNWLLDDINRKQEEATSPWFTSILTISSHNPFDVPYHKFDRDKNPSWDDVMKNGFAYTDSCYADFINRLSKTEAWKNLLVVTVADHGFNWRPINSPDFPIIPFTLMGGVIKEPRRIETLVSQTDIPATILGQLGIPHEEFVFSRDVLGNTYTHPFGFNTFNNGFNLRDSSGCTVFDNVAGSSVYGPDANRERMGKAILQTLYRDMGKR
ncbi:MAG: LTA synthase family protein [Bacteroidaceae bacterium]|nr:LTA synthase family protein [Bacteroidaceae bacterium]